VRCVRICPCPPFFILRILSDKRFEFSMRHMRVAQNFLKQAAADVHVIVVRDGNAAAVGVRELNVAPRRPSRLEEPFVHKDADHFAPF
jgi:hypothetical protein